MFSLTAAQRASLDACTKPIWYVMILKNGLPYWPGTKFAYLFTAGNLLAAESDDIPTYRNRHTTPDSLYAYVPGRMSASSITGASIEVDPRRVGGISKTATMNFTLEDDDNYISGLENSGVYFAGHRVYLYLNTGIVADVNDDILCWSGRISDIDRDVRSGQITYRCESMDTVYDRKIPPRVWDPNDPTVWSFDVMKDNLKGKAVPLLFGAHDQAQGFTLADVYDDGSADRGRLVQFCDMDWAGIPGGFGGVNDILYGDEGLVEATGGMAYIDNSSGRTTWTERAAKGMAYFTSAHPTRLNLAAMIQMRSYLLYQAGAAGVTDHINGIDGDLSTYASIASIPGSPATPYRNLMFKVPKIDLAGTIQGTGETDCEIYFVGKVTPSIGGSDWQTWSGSNWSTNARTWGFFLEATTLTNPNGFGFQNINFAHKTNMTLPVNNIYTPASWTAYPLREDTDAWGAVSWSEYSELSKTSEWYCGVGIYNGTATASGSLQVKDCRLYIRFWIDFPGDGFYADAEGYLDTTGGTITGTASRLIENPAHIVAYTARYLMGFGATYTDIASFRAVANGIRSGWELAVQLTGEQIQALDFFDDLGRDAGIWIWTDRAGFLRCFAVDGTAGSDFLLHESDVVDGQLESADLTPLTDVATKFIIRYKPNAVGDGYAGVLSCTDSSSHSSLGATYEAMCAAAKERYTAGQEVEKVIDLDMVRDEATALAAARLLIARYTSRQHIIKWLGDITDAHLELGDRFEFAVAEWSHISPTITAGRYVITGVRPRPGDDNIQFTAVQTA